MIVPLQMLVHLFSWPSFVNRTDQGVVLNDMESSEKTRWQHALPNVHIHGPDAKLRRNLEHPTKSLKREKL